MREQVLRRTREEVPHAVEVEVDEVEERHDGLLAMTARIWVETESQKGILIGWGSSRASTVSKGDVTAEGPRGRSTVGWSPESD